MTIVKVQVPITSSAPLHPNQVLIYDELHQHMRQQLVDQNVFYALKDDLKGYFEAEFSVDQDCWVVGKRIEDQPW